MPLCSTRISHDLCGSQRYPQAQLDRGLPFGLGAALSKRPGERRQAQVVVGYPASEHSRMAENARCAQAPVDPAAVKRERPLKRSPAYQLSVDSVPELKVNPIQLLFSIFAGIAKSHLD